MMPAHQQGGNYKLVPVAGLVTNEKEPKIPCPKWLQLLACDNSNKSKENSMTKMAMDPC